jgi:hypothetical protein
MFQFPPFALHTYGFSMQYSGMTRNGLSHSEIPGSKTVSVSPGLIAGNHVLHSLLMPRHPPYALSNFTVNLILAQMRSRRQSFRPAETGLHFQRRNRASMNLLKTLEHLIDITGTFPCGISRSILYDAKERNCATAHGGLHGLEPPAARSAARTR